MIRHADFSSRPTVAHIHLKNLTHNYEVLRAKTPGEQKICGIIKANAYGHGLLRVAQCLEAAGVDAVGVATFEEGKSLRDAGCKLSVYVLDGILAPLIEYKNENLIPVLHTKEELMTAIDFSRNHDRFFKVSLKFDTGMGRLGFFPEDLPNVLKWLAASTLQVDTVLTHLACADEALEKTLEAYEKFHAIQKDFEAAGLTDLQFSICNSASVLDGHFDDFHMVRPGLALYGAYPNPRQKNLLDLKPVLSWQTRITSLKTYQPGQTIGYGATFTVQRESKIAILPLGYADGYPRSLSNCGEVLVRGQKVPVVGRVSMDLTAIDVTDVADVEIYDSVVLIGSQGEETITADDLASWAGTISYEILTGIQKRVPRVYQE